MKATLPLSIITWLTCVSLHAEPVNLGGGTLDIPRGVTHIKCQGIDSAIGSFVSADGTPRIEYDIGSGPQDLEIPKDASEFAFLRSGTTAGTPYYAAIRKTEPRHFFVVFPRCGPAFFWATVASPEETERALKLILKFTPDKTPK